MAAATELVAGLMAAREAVEVMRERVRVAVGMAVEAMAVVMLVVVAT